MSVERYYPRRSCRSTRQRMSGPSWSPVAPGRGSAGPSNTSRSARGGSSIMPPTSPERSAMAWSLWCRPPTHRARAASPAERRAASRVRAGLAAVPGRGDDRVRARRRPPVRLTELFAAVIEQCAMEPTRAVPGVAVTDTIKRSRRRQRRSSARPPASTLVAVQTPQAFRGVGAARCSRQRSARRPTMPRSSSCAVAEWSWLRASCRNRKITIPTISRGRESSLRRKADDRRACRSGLRRPPLQRRPAAQVGARWCRFDGNAGCTVTATPMSSPTRSPMRCSVLPDSATSASTFPTPIRGGRTPTRWCCCATRHTGASRWLDHRQRRLLSGVRDAEAGAAPGRNADQVEHSVWSTGHGEGPSCRRAGRARASRRYCLLGGSRDLEGAVVAARQAGGAGGRRSAQPRQAPARGRGASTSKGRAIDPTFIAGRSQFTAVPAAPEESRPRRGTAKARKDARR